MTGGRVRRPHRAQCSVCGNIIESFHPWDSVTCACGRLSLSGGPERPQVFWQAGPGSSWTDLSDEVDHDSEQPENTDQPPLPARGPGFKPGG